MCAFILLSRNLVLLPILFMHLVRPGLIRVLISKEALRRRDPLGMGMPDEWAIKLLRRLLRWNAEERITAQRALQHAFFRPDSLRRAGAGFRASAVGGDVEEDENPGGLGSSGYRCGSGLVEYEFADDAAAAC